MKKFTIIALCLTIAAVMYLLNKEQEKFTIYLKG